VRDLGSAEPWRESLERSRIRRHQPPKRRRGVRRANFWAIGGAAALVVAVPNVLANHGTRASATSNEARLQEYASSPRPATIRPTALPRQRATRKVRPCVPSRASSGYVNPLARARVASERIEQGVDYAGTGTLTAIGEATVTKVATLNTGWPGNFVEYRLLHGPDAGCSVYYAEGVEPVSKLRVGERLHAGQAVATLISGWATGIEIGWGAGVNTESLAMQYGKWNAEDDADDKPSSAGKSFSALVAALGGPAGKVEG
jgi:hypothetical protein